MFGISPETANFGFDISNIALVFGSVVVFLSTIGIYEFGKIKETFSNERISRANADAEIAKEGTAKAEVRVAELTLELAKLKAPRTLTSDQQQSIIAATQKFQGQKYCALLPSAGTDTESLWASLDKALASAGWTRVGPPGLVVGNPPAGVTINAMPGIYIGVAPSRKSEFLPIAQAFATTLNGIGIAAQAGLDTEADKDPTTIRIIIGLKPL